MATKRTRSSPSLYNREPARVVGVIAGGFTSAGSCLIAISAGASVAGAIGAALVTFGGVIGGTEIIRSQVTPVAGS